jgi:hypothetical protein
MKAYRCDITGECIPIGESADTKFLIDSGTTTILGVENVGIELVVNITVPDVTEKAHVNQAVRDAVLAKIKAYANANW